MPEQLQHGRPETLRLSPAIADALLDCPATCPPDQACQAHARGYHAGPPMQGGARGRGRRGGYPEPGRMGDGNGLAFGFDAGRINMLLCILCSSMPTLNAVHPCAWPWTCGGLMRTYSYVCPCCVRLKPSLARTTGPAIVCAAFTCAGVAGLMQLQCSCGLTL